MKPCVVKIENDTDTIQININPLSNTTIDVSVDIEKVTDMSNVDETLITIASNVVEAITGQKLNFPTSLHDLFGG